MAVTGDLTPMLKQYYEVKDECGDAIVLFRLGDFFEMFGDDAKVASQVLGITLTGRDAGKTGRIPMCGVPHHAVDGYVAKLISAGFRVALCDQMEDPRLAKGLVKREVVRIVTPGTILDGAALDDKANQYLVSLVQRSGRWGLAYVDVSTGTFATTEVGGEEAVTQLLEELDRLQPAELLLPETGCDGERPARPAGEYAPLGAWLEGERVVAVSPFRPGEFGVETATTTLLRHFGTVSLDGFGCAGVPLAVSAAGALLAYLEVTQRSALSHLTSLHTYALADTMSLDPATRRSLELTQAQRDGGRRGSLLWALDRTVTAGGGRQLRLWVEQPLLQAETVNARLDAVQELVENTLLREELREYLGAVYDLERLIGRVGCGLANARDLLALRDSCVVLPNVRAGMSGVGAPLLVELRDGLADLGDVSRDISAAIAEAPPVNLKEGGLIRDGFDGELDELRGIARDGKTWIANLEAQERETTGIKNLKIGFNKVFGYYLEVTNANLAAIPEERYQRKQTLANAERFVTPELKEFEAKVLGAEEKMIEREYQLFLEVRERVGAATNRIQATARALAKLDVLSSLAQVAVAHRYVRPLINTAGTIEIRDGRHPVVERFLSDGEFVPNDSYLDGERARFLLVTGPNMAGKSTYLRQTALIVLMAQIGSFVPASAAVIGLVDRVFTRVGAADDLATGQSTFMVEMNEVANILHHATARSLIILDEVGRGTSTFDGLAIAWAVTEHINSKKLLGAKTLFATHYHELIQLEKELDGFQNLSVVVKREGGKIAFLRKIVPGGADESYGIEVAQLAGLPRALLSRAREILKRLERLNLPEFGPSGSDDGGVGESTPESVVVGHRRSRRHGEGQLGLFVPSERAGDAQLLRELGEIDPLTLTPLEALNVLSRLSEAARKQLTREEASEA